MYIQCVQGTRGNNKYFSWVTFSIEMGFLGSDEKRQNTHFGKNSNFLHFQYRA